jgi:ribosomal protein L11 methyltransferase
MREVALTVRRDGADAVIDRVIALAPYGILRADAGDAEVLRIRGAPDELRRAAEYAALAGDDLISVTERAVPDEWHERRVLDHEPLVIGRVCVRPRWAPVAQGAVDVVIDDDGEAFGTGAHATTRACLAMLCELDAAGPLADLGCGSGILAVAASKLGFAPVTAVDNRSEAVAATRAAAAANGVALEIRQLDLLRQAPPFARTICANVPAPIHAAVVARLPDWPDFVIASGFAPSALEQVAGFYDRLGLAPGRRTEGEGWITCLLSRDGR